MPETRAQVQMRFRMLQRILWLFRPLRLRGRLRVTCALRLPFWELAVWEFHWTWNVGRRPSCVLVVSGGSEG